ncbi:outer membrane beta-barrel protein [Chitinophaga sp. SYP-B3965]|uniref:outer membrane beta-barrel protein n=1 Tax=Chitinophaga sp. SYP-B3965 TaxID=2663120 RepID=UPI00129972DA|nr:outer membrane beta-barrel protein [Chitinophaga sp. SYP-B3965]MRG46801.1 outer membrane beta-barrel protein [Chitinophaga sp. SYP-B3965]
MKKMIVVAVLGLIGTQFANAQVKKGNILLGGTVGVHTESDKTDGVDGKRTFTSFGISPKIGYAVSDKWVVGVFANTSFNSNKDLAGVKGNTNTIAPGIFVRNYHNIGESKFAFFGEANVSYGFGSSETADVKTQKTTEIDANILPGIAYFVTKRFNVEGVFGGINFNSRKVKPQPTGAETTETEFGLQFTQQFNLGVNWLF